MDVVIWLIVSGLAALIGASVASQNNRDAAVWGIICFIFPLAVLVVYAVGEAPKPAEPTHAGLSYDRKKWEALVEFDPDVRAAAQSLEPHGAGYVDQLAAKFLALNDKTYLPQIKEKLLADAAAEAAKTSDPAYIAEMCSRVRELYVTPTGRVVVLHDWSVLGEVEGKVDSFAHTAAYREYTLQGSAIWDDVTDDATRREFIERFRAHWPGPELPRADAG